MKRLPLLFILLFTVIGLKAQIPQGFSYQAIYRDSEGNSVSNQNVTVKFSIIDSIISGPNLYIEQHNSTTNEFGLITLTVGSGTVQTGNFSSINWTKKSKFLKVEINGTLSGITQLLSVPYAMVAGNGSSWKDTTTLYLGKTYDLIKTNRQAFIQTTSNTGIGLSLDQIEIWGNYPLLDFKNNLEKDAEMRIGYDTVTIDRLSISSLNANNQWNWDQFVFTKNGNLGVGVAIPKEKIQAIGNVLSSSTNDSSYVLVGGDDGAIILQRQNDGPYIDFTKDRANPTGNAFRIQSVNGGLSLITTNSGNLVERVRILPSGNFGIGTINPKSKLQISNGDVYIENATNGVVMKSPNGQCWRMTVSNSGQPVYNLITCP